ncbi:BREX-2 system adenine-specific DNA-methyltransferase PglX [Ideonella sp. A 288]|uniref:BREX-2 system adenine-specific DNA-methyltransferase PglX n=1 Tax=Ideonella sp. A 288 TaxID=1962181 RepID=UPI000B4AEBBC|nr:BREX-2 system adenine-specific DNA-methyltransferase PglX [Ideonella sp. A 288]
MINAKQLLADLTRQLKRLEDDLRDRIFQQDELPELKAALQLEWQAAREAERCAETFESWVEQVLTQAGVHWLLSGVFLRFIEDNALVDRPWIAGPPASGRLALAQDRFETYFRAHPLENERDYLVAAFREAGALPGLQTFFDADRNPVFRLPISGDAAKVLRQFWQQVDPDTGDLVHDFTDADWNTRFLGDLYQDLSEATRKRYALLQTPEFVEEFILDRTLTPAIREFGFRDVRMIDPTCGSGHFLLGGFHRLVAEWLQAEPGLNPGVIAKSALNAVAGVDLNPFAAAIARFRLWVAALKVAEVRRLADAPDFQVHVAIGDSLLHGSRFGLSETASLLGASETLAGYGLNHAYVSEDLTQVQQILSQQYHAVVGNPPYIVVKDAALNAAYRLKYPRSCHMKYSLGAPFTERFFELALTPKAGSQGAGYVGLITANSFMKREFGSKLIEQVLPRLDLSHVVDTSGAYIPGHGTPTVILFGRHRAPVSESVRTVMGIKSEPSTPNDPARGLVWSAIVNQIDRAGSESEFVSATDTLRATFGKHPWSIGGGGASELREQLEGASRVRLSELVDSLGFMAITGEDDAYLLPRSVARRLGAPIREFILGDVVRDWSARGDDFVVFPYVERERLYEPCEVTATAAYGRLRWRNRSFLRSRVMFGKTAEQHGYRWDQYMQFIKNRVAASFLITFAEVATHNHFVLDRGGKVFKQTAPVIKLTAGSAEDDHLGLLGLLNSSVACFWLQQVCHNKGRPGAESAGADERFEMRYAINASNVAEFPLVEGRPLDIAARIDRLAQELAATQPAALLAQPTVPTRQSLDTARERAAQIRRQMFAAQDELDWRCYRLYGLLPADVDEAEVEYADAAEINLGERAFEIVLARQAAAGRVQTVWFERHGASAITEVPAHWPAPYRAVVQRRIALIENDKTLGLMERPEHKRRWNSPAWQELEQAALRDWLLDKLESPALWPVSADRPPQLTSTRRLADAVAKDAAFMQIAELYAGQAGFDVQQLVADLVSSESVPFLPVLRYSETGLRKRDQWQATWALQRQEDAIDAKVVADNTETWRAELTAQAKAQFGSAGLATLSDEAQAWIEQQLAAEIARQQAEDKAAQIGPIPVPPKYQSKDFLKADFWRLRGGLDVPKERWVSYTGCERGADGSLPLAWAGWNHLQQATALASYLLEMKDNEGWEPERLQPLLAGLDELVPWLKQWHNEPDPAFDGERMGDYYEGFVADQARELGYTLADLRSWKPTVTAKRRGGRPRKVVA